MALGDLATLLGPALVIDLSHLRSVVEAAGLDIAEVPAGVEWLLIKTANSRHRVAGVNPADAFDTDFGGTRVE